MILEDGLYRFLASLADLNAIINRRIYPNVVEQTAQFPLVRMQRISGNRHYILAESTGVANPRIQIDAMSQSYAQAKDISKLLRMHLQDFVGRFGDDTDNVTILEINLLGDADYYDDVNRIHTSLDDYEIWHTEEQSVPLSNFIT